MHTNRRCSLTIAALIVAFTATACTDSPDPVGVPTRVSLPPGASRNGIAISTAVEFADGEGKLDITDVTITTPDGMVGGGPLIITGKYQIKSIPECGGCKVTAYIGSLAVSFMPDDDASNFVLAETDGTNLPITGTFTWTTRLRKTDGQNGIGAGQIASSQFTPITRGHLGDDLLDDDDGESGFMWDLVSDLGIFPIVTGTINAAGWYNETVSLSWDVVFTVPTTNTKTGCDPVVVATDTDGQTFVCSATAGFRAASRPITIKRDATKPTISNFAVAPAPNASGWRNGNANASWQCTDDMSKPVNVSGSQTLSADGANQTATATCVDNASNTATQTITGINIDRTAPTLSPTLNVAPIVQNAAATASPNASDALSGVASASCDPVVTSQVGTFSVNCEATDLAGNKGTKSVDYVVKSPFTFSGFQAPVVPGTLNARSAGAAVPVKFSLGGNKGLNIFAAGSPTSRPLTCPAGATVTTTTETAASGNGGGIQYDATTDTYTYVWKTEKAWAGTCRTLVVKLTDGIERTADFQFKK